MSLFLCFLVVLSTLALVLANIPQDWQRKVDTFNGFYAENDDGIIDSTGYPHNLYMPLIGNGYISHAKGVRSDTMFVSGVFNGQTTSPSHRAAIPASFAVTVNNSKTRGVLMDVQSGTYFRRGSIEDKAWYELRWYAHRSIRCLYVMELDVHVLEGDSVTLTLSQNTLSSTADFKELSRQKVNNGKSESVCRVTTIPEIDKGPTTTVCVIADIIPSTITIKKADSGKTITFVSATRTSLDVDGVENVEIAATSEYNIASSMAQQNTLYSTHVDGWNAVWDSGIEVGGRPDVSTAVNASLYAILSSVRDDWPYGLAPGGLTNYYNGHSFWDTETWMYPPLMFLQPKLSRSLIQYRFDRLEGARMKAQSYSPPWAGTMFPWESAFSGVETCPTFAATGLREDHISGDISLGIWQEWCMRKDENWLRTIAYPILQGVADFWVSRSVYETDSNGVETAHIKDVIPPDEYVDHVDDSVYTNYVASQALRFAVKASSILNVTCDSCNTYQKLADSLVILFDPVNGIHPEYKNYPGDTVKQADVVLLHYPLGMEMDDGIRRADLDYYSERTDHHGPAMTWGMHSIGFLDLEDHTNAAKFFNMSFQDNLHAPLQVWTETPDGNAVNFITGAGGFLQTMINGYPGFRITENGLLFNPRCPEGVTYIKMRQLNYLNVHFNVFFSCESSGAKNVASKLTLEPSQDSSLSLHVVKRGSHSPLAVIAKKLLGKKVIEVDLGQLRSKYGSFQFRLTKDSF